jgi:6-phosphofructokinase 1
LLSNDIYGVCVGVRDSKMIHLPLSNVVGQRRPKNLLYNLYKRIS